jgi:dipeptidyl aminopeptidase/acylaminoacyl peptidase
MPVLRGASPRLLVALLATSLGGCGGCAGSPGQVVGRQPDLHFVTEKATLFFAAGGGIERIDIDGTDRRVVFPRHDETGVHFLDVSPDFRTFLLEDSSTDLLVGDVATGSVRHVAALANRTSTARFSPDGRRIAAARHSDYHRSGSKEDDTLYLVDTATLATQKIAQVTANWPTTIRWAADGSGLWVEMAWNAPPQWVTLADSHRHHGLTSAPVPIQDLRRPKRATCTERAVSDGRQTTLRMVPVTEDGGGSELDAPDAGRVIVELQGRERGFHDYQPDFYDPMLSPGCSYVVFGMRGDIWVADATATSAANGAAAPLVAGGASALFFAPR